MRKTVISSLLFLCIQSIYAMDYHVSSTTGNDNNDGSINAPFQTLAKASAVSLSPGDKLLFKKGDTFVGQLVINSSGTKEAPIHISSYGTGDQPIISGAVGSANGGDHEEAIYILDQDHFVIEDIEVQNERTNTRSGVDDELAFGIYVQATTRSLSNFVIRNVTIKNVYAVKEVLSAEDFDGLEVSGIRFFSAWNTTNQHQNIEDILIEDCYFEDLQRLGVHFKHGGSAESFDTEENARINRIADVVCRNNTFYYLGGTSILPQRTYNCLIENNVFDHPGATTDPRMPGRGSSVWTFHCINTVIQYNQCLSTRGYLDSHGIHVDHHNENTFIQYNYMEDCEGGFVEVLKGNKNAVYRYNVSVNDGWRNGGGATGAWANSNHTIWVDNGDDGTPGAVVETSKDTYIYNNTVVLDYNNVDDPDKKETTAIDVRAENTNIFNNIFYAINLGEIGQQQVRLGSETTVTNNLFFGAVDSRFESADKSPITGDPNFNYTGDGEEQYQLAMNSPALGQGTNEIAVPAIPGAGTGIFKDVSPYPTEDLYGNPLGDTPSIGAYHSEQILAIDKTAPENEFLVSPNPAEDSITITIKTAGNHHLRLIDSLGKSVLEKSFDPAETTIKLDVSKLQRGIYLIKVGDQSHQRIILR